MGRHKKPDLPDDERGYEVGYRKAPEATRFAKGAGGNKKGRQPKERKSTAEKIDAVLNQLVIIRRGGKTTTITMEQAIFESQANKAAQGNTRAAEFLMRNLARERLASGGGSGAEYSAEDRAILQRLADDFASGRKSIEDILPSDVTDAPEADK